MHLGLTVCIIDNASNYIQIQNIHSQSFNHNMDIETNLDNIHVCGEEQQIGSCSHPKEVEMLPIINNGIISDLMVLVLY